MLSKKEMSDVKYSLRLTDVKKGNAKLAESLLSNGCLIDEMDKSTEQTALHIAVSLKNKSMVKILLSHNPDVRVFDINGNTPLHIADLVRYANSLNNNFNTPIYLAARVNEECILFVHHTENDKDIGRQLKNFWNVESFGVDTRAKALRSKEDQRAGEILNQTACRRGDHWETGLLWKSDNEVLPESKKVEEQRFRTLEKKMAKDPYFKRQYEKTIEEYCTKKYARILTAEEERLTTPRTWYLPHFAVTNPNKPGKIRLVWDAAAKSQGVSLNDKLLKGPDLYNSQTGILSIFRERPVAICGDMKEMFHQVLIREEDQGSQRFLGRGSQTGEMRTLQMEVMIFGAVSPPYVAQEIKNRNAEEFKEAYPEASRAIKDRHYMDDHLDSMDTTEEAIIRAQQ